MWMMVMGLRGLKIWMTWESIIEGASWGSYSVRVSNLMSHEDRVLYHIEYLNSSINGEMLCHLALFKASQSYDCPPCDLVLEILVHKIHSKDMNMTN